MIRLSGVLRCLLLVVAILILSVPPTSSAAAKESERYIVVLEDSVEHPAAVARAQSRQRDGRLGFVYRHALNGYSAVLPKAAVQGLRADPAVVRVERDVRGGVAAQTTPTGIKRIFATANEAFKINEQDDLRTDVDVAVLDTGIDADHPDLDVVSQVNCNGSETCVAGGDDGNGHGTHVGGTIAAIDNGKGVVGVAPGARLWSVKILDSGGFGLLSEFIAGVDWITGTREDEDPANDIEVANASVRYFTTSSPTMTEALKAAVEAGIVPVAAAGNESEAVQYVPGNDPYVITVSALADYDGQPGAKASPTCENFGADDDLASFSNFGNLVEVAAPGVCIYSTLPGGSYGFSSGTSMASPHVAGAAAVLASQLSPDSQEDAAQIYNTIIEEGNLGWEDTSEDGAHEPLLDVEDEGVFAPVSIPAVVTKSAIVDKTSATLRAVVNPEGAETSYQFEYGATAEYGQSIPLSPKAIGSGTAFVEVSEIVEGLEPEATYHYRVAATNSGGTTYGEDQEFTAGIGPFDGLVKSASSGAECNGTSNCIVTVSGNYEAGIYQCTHEFSIVFDADGTFFTKDHSTSGIICNYVPCAGSEGEVWPGFIQFYETGIARGTIEACIEHKSGGNEISDLIEFELVNQWDGVGLPDVLLTADNEGGNLNLSGTWYGVDEELQVHIGAVPAATTDAASTVCDFGATLNATVNPNNLATEFQFEYGTTKEYGSTAPATPEDIGSGTQAVGLSEDVLDLSPETTYHYRVVATNEAGTTNGEDREFTTPSPGEPPESESNCYGGSVPAAPSDVNGDGHSDLVTTYFGTAAVHAGKADGTFQTAVTSLGKGEGGPLDSAQYDGVGHYVIDVADVDRNGRADLITLDDGGDVHVFPGWINKKFGTATVSALGLTPGLLEPGGHEMIGAADVNGDGRADLVSYDEQSDKLMVHPGKSDRTFGTGIEAGTGVASALYDASGEYFLDVADTTGDGHADLISMSTSDELRVYRGKSDGTFQAPVDSHEGQIDPAMDDAKGYEPAGVGDVTGDGRADLALIDNVEQDIMIYPGQATGAFGSAVLAWNASTPSTTFGADPATAGQMADLLDVTGDGRADAVGTTGFVAWSIEGEEAGDFGEVTVSLEEFHTNQHDTGGHEIASEKPAWKRRGCAPKGCFRPAHDPDVNGDERADIVTLRTDGTVWTRYGKSDGTFNGPSGSFSGEKALDPAQYDGEGDYMIDVADVDRNGHADLIALEDDGDVTVYPGRKHIHDVGTTTALGLTPALLSSGGHEPIEAGDVNGDGRADLVSYDDQNDRVMVYPGKSDRTFGSGVEARKEVLSALHSGSGDYFLGVGDVNGDGFADLVSLNTSSKALLVYRGKSNSTFEAPVASHENLINLAMDDAEGFEPAGLGDVNGDDRVDVPLINTISQKLYVGLGQTNGTISVGVDAYEGKAPTSTFEGDPATHAQVAGFVDVTGDGRADMTGITNTEIFTLSGETDGTVGAPVVTTGSVNLKIKTTQHNKTAAGHQELASEIPSWKRRGCSESGC